jgi:hypothetical protein
MDDRGFRSLLPRPRPHSEAVRSVAMKRVRAHLVRRYQRRRKAGESGLKLDQLVEKLRTDGLDENTARWAIDECRRRRWARVAYVERSGTPGSSERAWEGEVVHVTEELMEKYGRRRRNLQKSRRRADLSANRDEASVGGQKKSCRRPGRRRVSAEKAEEYMRLVAAWKTQSFPTYADLAREMKTTSRKVEQAVDWHRQRTRRAGQ